MAKSEYPNDAKTFGEKIRKKRMDLDWSLITVADKTDISESYLARIEADKQRPTPEIALRIIDSLGLNRKDFYSFVVAHALAADTKLKISDSILEELKKPHAWEKVLEILEQINNELNTLPHSRQRSRIESLIEKIKTLSQKYSGSTFYIPVAVKLLIGLKEDGMYQKPLSSRDVLNS